DDLAQPKLEMVRGQCHTLEMALEEVAIIVGQLLPGAARAQMAAQRRHDERLDLGGGNAADQSGRRGPILQPALGDVIAGGRAPRCGGGWASWGGKVVKKGAREGPRATPPAGAAAGGLGPKVGPAPPRTRHDPQSAPVRRHGPRPGRPPRRYRSGS